MLLHIINHPTHSYRCRASLLHTTFPDGGYGITTDRRNGIEQFHQALSHSLSLYCIRQYGNPDQVTANLVMKVTGYLRAKVLQFFYLVMR
jgi:hypothetical protein